MKKMLREWERRKGKEKKGVEKIVMCPVGEGIYLFNLLPDYTWLKPKGNILKLGFIGHYENQNSL